MGLGLRKLSDIGDALCLVELLRLAAAPTILG